MRSYSEISIQFDILYNNITSNQAPGLNEYEKSLFLTKAQDEIIKNYFFKENNTKGKGIEESEKRHIDFSHLVTLEDDFTISNEDNGIYPYYDNNNYVYHVTEQEEEPLLILNEFLTIKDGNTTYVYILIPITHKELDRLVKKPYKLPLKGQAWKIKTDTGFELIGNFELNKLESPTPVLRRRYIKYPNPIITGDIGSLTIRGKSYSDSRALDIPDELIDEVINRAVELAKNSWQGDLKSTIELNNRGE